MKKSSEKRRGEVRGTCLASAVTETLEAEAMEAGVVGPSAVTEEAVTVWREGCRVAMGCRLASRPSNFLGTRIPNARSAPA